MDAHRANASRRLVEKEIYGKVEYFIVHKYNGSERMFAYVHKTDYESDNYTSRN